MMGGREERESVEKEPADCLIYDGVEQHRLRVGSPLARQALVVQPARRPTTYLELRFLVSPIVTVSGPVTSDWLVATGDEVNNSLPQQMMFTGTCTHSQKQGMSLLLGTRPRQ